MNSVSPLICLSVCLSLCVTVPTFVVGNRVCLLACDLCVFNMGLISWDFSQQRLKIAGHISLGLKIKFGLFGPLFHKYSNL